MKQTKGHGTQRERENQEVGVSCGLDRGGRPSNRESTLRAAECAITTAHYATKTQQRNSRHKATEVEIAASHCESHFAIFRFTKLRMPNLDGVKF